MIRVAQQIQHIPQTRSFAVLLTLASVRRTVLPSQPRLEEQEEEEPVNDGDQVCACVTMDTTHLTLARRFHISPRLRGFNDCRGFS